jgi:acyl-homoserine-lactone acylase
MRSGVSEDEAERWKARAHAVTITRDDWGIAHVHGKTDADAVFGMIYAQAEDDFNRIEHNYLTALGRLAEVAGEAAIYKDLRVRLFVGTDDLKARHAASPAWLRTLMDAWADGLNYYLSTRPGTSPRAIRRFEPWMALSFTEGGVIGDIARVPVDELEAFYGKQAPAHVETRVTADVPPQEELGSNAFAIAPTHSLSGNALLLINPHPDFYFRSELHVQSDEGWNCYGAVTWGQFFVFQGFNDKLGWGHTTTGAHTVDEYAETPIERGNRMFYLHGGSELAMQTSEIEVPYRTAAGGVSSRRFTTFRTHHGPVIREAGDRWISIAMMYKPVEALTQSFLRMKAGSYAEFVETARLKANSGVNTVYADKAGNIAFFPPQFMPRRDLRFDFTQPVDGTNPATDWKGEHEIDELPQVSNPPNGWIVNTNNAPYFVAGACSPEPRDHPGYLDTAGQNPRGVNATRLLGGRRDFTLASLIAAAYDPHLSTFARLIPDLVRAHDRLPESDALKDGLAEQIAVLRHWDYRYSLDSIATSLSIFWGERVMKDVELAARARHVEIGPMFEYLDKGRLSASFAFRALDFIFEHILHDAPPELKLEALAASSDRLVRDFGTWRTPWGKINRFQRLSGGITQVFDDHRPSTPVPLTSSIWGALATFKSSPQGHTKCYYGTSGNGFVAAVEFGERIRARAIMLGGASGDPDSPHFNDQGARVTTGDLREVYFHRDQLQGHSERTYHPGE